MISILFKCRPHDSDRIVAELWELGTAGLLEEDGTLRAFFEDPAGVLQTVQALNIDVLEVRNEQPARPGEFSREDWEPVSIGNQFFLAPSWVTVDTPPGRLRLTVDSVMAFGTGRHESTQLMLECMEEVLQPEHSVLDVGCGSGILAAAARMLGSRRVVACDIDEDAIRSVRTEFDIPSFTGSADAVRDASADVLLVNISARILDALASELKRIAKPEGLLILSGFIADHPPRKFTPSRTFQRNDWLCWVCSPESVDATVATPGQILSHPSQWW